MVLKNRSLALSILTSLVLISCGGSGTAEEPPTKISYVISTSVSEGGTISPSSLKLNQGESAIFTLAPNEGFEVNNIIGCAGTLNNTTYSIESAAEDCLISVTFKPIYISQPENAPKVNIIFPAKNSLLIEKDGGMTFIGTATDDSGVKSVRINGIEAELTTIEKNIAKELTRSSEKTNTIRATPKESPIHYSEEVSWQVTLPSISGSTIFIETEDTEGNINSKANSLALFYNEYKAPSNFTIDATNNRLIGKVTQNSFNIFNLINKETSVYPVHKSDSDSPFAYYAKEDIILDISLTDTIYTLHSIDLNSGQNNILTTLDLSVEFEDWAINFTKVEVIQDTGSAYLLFNLTSMDGLNDDKSMIFKYDFSTNALSTFIDKKTINDKIVDASSFSYSSNGLLTIEMFSTRINKILLDASDSTVIVNDNDIRSSNIITDLIDNYAYVVGYKETTKIDLTTHFTEIISSESEAGELALSEIGSIAVDKENNQLLIGDEHQGIVGINLETGTRKVVVRDGIGQGASFVAPRAIVSDQDKRFLYVADEGGSAPAFISKVDLSTGDRVRIAEWKHNYNYYISGLALDETNNKLYVVIGDDIRSVNLSNNTVSVLSSNLVGIGVFMERPIGAELDVINNRLLTFDSANHAIISINLENGDRTIVSSSLTNAEVGSGIEIPQISSIAFDVKNQVIYASSQYYAHVVKIDLDTGERSLLLDSCKSESGYESLVESEGMWSSYYQAETKKLFLYSRDIIAYNIESKECSQTQISGLLDMVPTKQNTAYVSYFNNIYLLDLITGSKVIISK